MARIHFIVVCVLSLFLFSCGQVGSITGGDVDTQSPKIIVERVSPPMESTNISPQIITIPFDEFIEFNKAAENITVTPADVKLDYLIKKKSVILSVESGNWKPNTTYTIYLNRAVKDITEANDSIIAYVFSTGDYLDSLKTAIQVVDAYSGKPVVDVTVGLFTQQLENDSSNFEPRYYASTDNTGIAKFQFIKDTTFFAYAFEDDNYNNRIDPTEKRAVLRNPVKLDTIFETGSIIRLMPPETNSTWVISNEVIPTATWCLSFNRPLREVDSFTFIDPQPTEIIWNGAKDSLSAFYETDANTGTFYGVLHANDKMDTINKKYFIRDKTDMKIVSTNNLNNKKLWSNDTLKLKFNEPVLYFDNAEIMLETILEGDSLKSPIEYEVINHSPIEKSIFFNKKNVEKVFLSIPPKAIQGLNYPLKDSLNLDFTLQKEKETGVMIIEFDTIPAYGILVVTNKSTKLKRNIVFDGVEKSTHRIESMQPGEYGFHFIYDTDKSGAWTTGSIFENKDAEIIKWFNNTSTIRANWEVKTTLTIKLMNEELEKESENN
ncbi:Ig-like domain-containing protein [Brumimicrobium mesophilum]|uniref:Ig-like domain-containing protein n=1 Tax=Brumimicrobium mesophilum TaxID=392717 RepID=UPI000D1440B4|nr:Ig-like domain-containing protein [Brumimicrobium mesophilum]